jgi:tripartite-type tricarboxylate transporter receptor subunit TctC
MEEWFAFFASPSTPASLVDQLNRRLRSVIEDRELVELLKPLGLEVETSSPEELAALIEAHRREWQARMEATGIKAAAAVK